MQIRRLISMCLVFVLVLCLCSCSQSKSESNDSSATADSASKVEADVTQAPTIAETLIPVTNSGNKTLVAYFSATGNTRSVAEKIAEATGADTYEILADEPYSEEDLDHNDKDSRTSKEQNDDSARPQIGSEKISLDDYAIIYIGYPIWWGQAPRIMSTFVESYDFTGKTIFPFCTSGSSPIGDSDDTLAQQAGSGNWLDGTRFPSDATDEDIQNYINGSNL